MKPKGAVKTAKLPVRTGLNHGLASSVLWMQCNNQIVM